MARLDITLFGEPGLLDEGRSRTLRAPRTAWSLLALLVTQGRPLERAALAAALWPEHDTPLARATLRRYLHLLTSALPSGVAWIESDAKTIAWNASAPFSVDVLEFRKAIDEDRYADAIELYRGDLLGTAVEDATIELRERLRSSFLHALQTVALRALGERDFATTIRYAERLIAADEWREDAIRVLMTACYERGDRSRALQVYDRFERTLREQLAVAPMHETSALRDAIVAGMPLGAGAAIEELDRDRIPLVGRSRELNVLKRAWRQAAAGRGSAFFVSGEAGIGKTRLIRELHSMVVEQGGRVLVGRTSSPEAGALEAVVEALRGGLVTLARGDVDDAWIAALVPILPEIAALLRDQTAVALALEPDAERLRLREAFARTIQALARRKPLVVILEDLHWAGSETAEVVELFARRAAALPLLFVLTLRTEELRGRLPVEAVRRRLGRDRLGHTLAIGRLSEDEIAQLASHVLPPESDSEDGRRVTHPAGGHPLFAIQLLRNYVEAGDVPQGDAVVATIGAAIGERIKRLPSDAQSLIAVGATIGSPFTIEELSSVSGWDEARVLNAVGVLLDANVFGDRAAERFSYGFSHDVLEETACAMLAGFDLRARHHRIASVLEITRSGMPGCAAAIAAHWEACGEERRAAQHLVAAAQFAMANYARADAIAHARRAIALGLDNEERFAALAIVVRASMGIGATPECLNDLDALECLSQSLGETQRLEALLLRARVFSYYGAEAREKIDRDLGTVFEATTRADAKAKVGLRRAWMYVMGGKLAEAEVAVRGALDAAERSNDAMLLAEAREAFFNVVIWRGNIDEGIARLAELEKAVGRSDAFALRPLLMAYSRLVVETERLDCYYKAKSLANELAELDGDVMRSVVTGGILAYGATLEWDVDSARRGFTEEAHLAQQLGMPLFHVVAVGSLGALARSLGHIEQGEALARETRSLAIEFKLDSLLGPSAIHLSDAVLAAGRPAEAVAEAKKGLELLSKQGAPRSLADALAALGAAECAAGATNEGLAHLYEGLSIRRSCRGKRALAHDCSVLLKALLDAGKLDEATAVAGELQPIFTAPLELRNPGFTAVALARAAAGREDLGAAQQIYKRGRAAVSTIANKLTDPADRTAFSALPHNRELLEANL